MESKTERKTPDDALKSSSFVAPTLTFVGLVTEIVAPGRNTDRSGTRTVAWVKSGLIAANPSDKHGKHRYELSQFGLSPADIDSIFAEYREQCRIGAEGRTAATP